MTLTPFMILILAAFALFVGTLGWVSIWSNLGPSPAKASKAKPAEAPMVGASPRLSA
jgi:hypothetical protein